MATSKSPINLMRGWPNRALLPVQQIRAAAAVALSDPEIAFPGLEYGPDAGYEPCREALAAWLASFYKPTGGISPARICVTGGASQNLGCILNVYTDPEYTRNIWIVAPAYFLAFRIFEDAGFTGKMRAVPEDEHGIDIAFLQQELEKSEAKAEKEGNTKPLYKPTGQQRAKVYKHIIYCVPTFSNPSSRTMSLDRRRELVRLAREFDALVAPDEVYDVLQWPAADAETGVEARSMESAHLPRLVDIDRELDGGADREGADGFGNTCSNGTFSKIAGPGIRTGWAEGTEKFAHGLSQCGTSRSGGSPSQLTSTYVTHLLASGQIEKHIRTVLRPAYASRYRTLMRAIEAHLLPLGFSMPQPDRDVVGGYFVWLSLPEALTAAELAERCQEEENVIVAPGKLFAVPGDESLAFVKSIRLCFSYEEEENLSEGVERVARVARRMLGSSETLERSEMLERSEGNSTRGYVVVETGDERGGCDNEVYNDEDDDERAFL